MNSNSQLLGYTREGIPVEKCTETGSLAFTLISVGRSDISTWGFSIALEFNRNTNGRKRPYVVVHMGSLVIQSGWLF